MLAHYFTKEGVAELGPILPLLLLLLQYKTCVYKYYFQGKSSIE
jgi:hypothetical protein